MVFKNLYSQNFHMPFRLIFRNSAKKIFEIRQYYCKFSSPTWQKLPPVKKSARKFTQKFVNTGSKIGIILSGLLLVCVLCGCAGKSRIEATTAPDLAGAVAPPVTATPQVLFSAEDPTTAV